MTGVLIPKVICFAALMKQKLFKMGMKYTISQMSQTLSLSGLIWLELTTLFLELLFSLETRIRVINLLKWEKIVSRLLKKGHVHVHIRGILNKQQDAQSSWYYNIYSYMQTNASHCFFFQEMFLLLYSGTTYQSSVIRCCNATVML